MDGIFVAYHNTSEIFGFQYLPLEFIDEVIFGNRVTAEAVYKLALNALGEILLVIRKEYDSKEDIRLTLVLNKECTSLRIFSEKKVDSVSLISEAPVNLKQYELTTSTMINGQKQEDFHLDLNGRDNVYLLSCFEKSEKPDLQLYNSARKFITEKWNPVEETKSNTIRLGDFTRYSNLSSKIMSNIKRNESNADQRSERPITAPWTIIND